ncbi:hypothetical protein SKAU_G00355760 [Synaphobranchus kaupii]|uniref:PiggyBac transposable element-derived protein domain-containing protein n=1 Tax=Synaphobranchus kaupii TaxID=118154 RepID=A0A9Q1IFL8_SYNKA|nr:hypothetical protein SKAU_G00355760 [Synaphobranchus kaupii]
MDDFSDLMRPFKKRWRLTATDLKSVEEPEDHQGMDFAEEDHLDDELTWAQLIDDQHQEVEDEGYEMDPYPVSCRGTTSVRPDHRRQPRQPEDNQDNQVARLVKRDAAWEKQVFHQPKVIRDYNKHMGGVDRSDQMIKMYEVLHKTQKWWKTLFFHFIDFAAVNSVLLFQQWQQCHATPGYESRFANYC